MPRGIDKASFEEWVDYTYVSNLPIGKLGVDV
jgi:hypothetical protein